MLCELYIVMVFREILLREKRRKMKNKQIFPTHAHLSDGFVDILNHFSAFPIVCVCNIVSFLTTNHKFSIENMGKHFTFLIGSIFLHSFTRLCFIFFFCCFPQFICFMFYGSCEKFSVCKSRIQHPFFISIQL